MMLTQQVSLVKRNVVVLKELATWTRCYEFDTHRTMLTFIDFAYSFFSIHLTKDLAMKTESRIKPGRDSLEIRSVIVYLFH